MKPEAFDTRKTIILNRHKDILTSALYKKDLDKMCDKAEKDKDVGKFIKG
jgi:hypothetical protein